MVICALNVELRINTRPMKLLSGQGDEQKSMCIEGTCESKVAQSHSPMVGEEGGEQPWMH